MGHSRRKYLTTSEPRAKEPGELYLMENDIIDIVATAPDQDPPRDAMLNLDGMTKQWSPRAQMAGIDRTFHFLASVYRLQIGALDGMPIRKDIDAGYYRRRSRMWNWDLNAVDENGEPFPTTTIVFDDWPLPDGTFDIRRRTRDDLWVPYSILSLRFPWPFDDDRPMHWPWRNEPMCGGHVQSSTEDYAQRFAPEETLTWPD
jgi:hypothetical protein